jgi:ABC-type multidrug transport system fused ATPase/permease subunit
MIFSTHRFGNLTRHADLIMCVVFVSIHWLTQLTLHRYLNDSVILETGTHQELMKRESSDYARLWRLQAEAFL